MDGIMALPGALDLGLRNEEGRGRDPFLTPLATNTNAIRLYEHLGFVVRRHATFQAVRVPSGEEATEQTPH